MSRPAQTRPTETRRPRSSGREHPARLEFHGDRPGFELPPLGRPLLVAGIVAVIVLLVIVRLATLSPAKVKLTPTADTSARVAGSTPKPVWPSSGEAAFKVLGIGSLGSSGGETPRPTASLAKVMTAYLILEHHPLAAGRNGFTLRITQADASATAADIGQDQSVVKIAAGEQLDERQLLEALLIPSGDNIARILAAHQSGSVSAFVTEMNSEARALGMTHTTYTDPSGFEPTTVSTAADQLKVFEQAMRFKVFREIVAMPSVTLPVAGSVANFDPLIGEGFYGKTGSDSAAEGCLAFFRYVTVAGRRIAELGVVMDQGLGSDTYTILDAAGAAARTLADSVTRAIRVHTVLASGTAVMRAVNAGGASVHGVTAAALRVIGWGGVHERLSVTRSTVATGLAGGQRLGSVTLAGPLPTPRGGAATTTVKAASALSTPGLGWRISHIF